MTSAKIFRSAGIRLKTLLLTSYREIGDMLFLVGYLMKTGPHRQSDVLKAL